MICVGKLLYRDIWVYTNTFGLGCFIIIDVTSFTLEWKCLHLCQLLKVPFFPTTDWILAFCGIQWYTFIIHLLTECIVSFIQGINTKKGYLYQHRIPLGRCQMDFSCLDWLSLMGHNKGLTFLLVMYILIMYSIITYIV